MRHAAIDALNHRDLIHLWCKSIWWIGKGWVWEGHLCSWWPRSKLAEEIGALWVSTWESWWESVNGHPASTSGGAVVPHMSAHVHFEVTLGREGLPADSALEGLISCVCSVMDLQGTATGEWLTTHVTDMLQVRSLQEW